MEGDNIMEGLLVLRKVRELSPGALDYLYQDEGGKAYFPAFVDNDLSRDDAITQELMEVTQGFAVATAEGEVLKKFKDVASAEQARANAVPSFEVSLDIPGGEDFDEADEEAKSA
jgi:hypothetical protein